MRLNGERVRRELRARGHSVRDLVVKSGVAESVILNALNGHTRVRVSTLRKLSAALYSWPAVLDLDDPLIEPDDPYTGRPGPSRPR